MTSNAGREAIQRDPVTGGKALVGDDREYTVTVADVLEESVKIYSLWRTGLVAADSYESKFNWYYRRNPDGPPSVMFLHHSSEVDTVGAASVAPRRMRFNDTSFLTGVLVDFVVMPEHRTFFPALILQKEMQRHALQIHCIAWGLPNPKASAVFRRAGYQCIGQMGRYVRVLRSAGYLSRHLPGWVSRVVGPIIDLARLAALVFRLAATRGYSAKWQDRPDARFNDLWGRSAKPDQLMGVRDEQYLSWRFVDCPLATYSFLTLVSTSDQRLVGYAVCEFEQQTLHVRDFLVDSNVAGALSRLWFELAREAFHAGCASLSVEFFGAEVVQRELNNAGLTARAQSPLYAVSTDQSPAMLSEAHLYITGADLDG